MNPDSHVHENIPAYLASELDDAQRRTVELHLRECDSCRRELEDQKRLDEILSHAKTLSPRPELLQGVIKQTRLERKPAFRRLILPWLAAAAVIAVILFLLKVQKDAAIPGDVVKKSPIVKPENPQQPEPKLSPDEPQPEPVPQITKKDKKVPAPVPEPIEENLTPDIGPQETEPVALTPEEAEVVAELDELENMELISNYENLENLEIALIDEGGGSLR